ncbi:hypothetical protein [Methylobacterium oxalidis]|uniref:hypothetical protein n=1 Tax=Methylobacterium oxalidis TaxID=944322 RepID=UPI003315BE0C
MSTAIAFNIFRRRRQRSLCCAVRQSKPVPLFIQGETWEFGGTLSPSEALPAGFQLEAADDATRILGYYLFHGLSPAHHGPAAEPSAPA